MTIAQTNGNGATLGFEQTLWAAADKLRNNMDAAEYKHVVLGLIFLKYISDAFAELHEKLIAGEDGAVELEEDEDDEPFDEKMQRLVTTLSKPFADSVKLETAIRSNLKGLNYG